MANNMGSQFQPSGGRNDGKLLNSQNYNSTQNINLKFDKTSNLANLGSLTKGQNLNNTMGSSNSQDAKGRYKQKSNQGNLGPIPQMSYSQKHI